MAQGAEQEKTQGPDELKKKLARRGAIAGVLIALLLGGLALYDYLAAPGPVPAVRAPEAPAPAAAPAAPEAKEATPEAPKAEPQAEPEKSETPLAPAPKAPPVEAKAPPGKGAAPLAAAAHAKKAEPAAPAAKPAEAKPAALPSMPRGYVLQVGVFSNAANAEDLQAKLQAAGIASSIEARVQLGPFKSRKEALEAREKLKAAGFGAGMLIPPRK